MAHAPAIPAETAADQGPMVWPAGHAAPVTPGKVAMWLFLATEVMFFTGLIGSYIVLRAGSPPTAYLNHYPPNTDPATIDADRSYDVVLESVGSDRGRVLALVRSVSGLGPEEAEHLVHSLPRSVKGGMTQAEAEALRKQFEAAGAQAKVEPLVYYPWPKPYHYDVNPLSIDLTAVNTFILICSSVTMVLALSAIQRGNPRKLSLFLLATVLIGATFLSIQVYEYRQLMFVHHYPIGISADGHFRPHVSLFASCFFTMTGFHGAHVAGGVILLTCIFIQSLRGVFTRHHHSAVELAGLYWHFVDLVWIILFTVVYLI